MRRRSQEFLREVSSCDMTTRPEYEASVVAAAILLDPEEILAYIYEYGYTSEQIAQAMDTDIKIPQQLR